MPLTFLPSQVLPVQFQLALSPMTEFGILS